MISCRDGCRCLEADPVRLWLVSSLALKFYVQSIADYNASYGAVGAVIVVLIWFYVSGLAILIGAEMDAEIVNARHKAAGLPVPPDAQTSGTPDAHVRAQPVG